MKRIVLILFLMFLAGEHAYGESEESAVIDEEAAAGESADESSLPASPLDRRLERERLSRRNPFSITPHKPNYLLPLTYNKSPNNEPFTGNDFTFDHTEVVFQLSFKVDLWHEFYRNNGYLSFAYTAQSFWQAYNTGNSSPFRETVHEPELMLSFLTDYRILGFRNRVITAGLVHQSNGRSGDLSRSWNRIYGNFIFEKDNLYITIKPWYRIPENEEDDDNPDINAYLGYGEIYALYYHKSNVFGLLLRNNLRSENRGSVRFDWSFPITEKLKG
ncbi:MAG: phospholipase A [Nitrospiraceae bacterium]|nr:MAG: phospholipase A [Nitrospiraceae bacterium]